VTLALAVPSQRLYILCQPLSRVRFAAPSEHTAAGRGALREVRSVTLFHYSALAYLAPILAEGLRRGAIAVPWKNAFHEAVSLTTQADPDGAAFWIDPFPWKLGVRYVCEIADDDPKLEPTKEAWKRLKVPKKWVEAFDPRGQAKWWSFYHGTIPPDRFVVELRCRRGYVRPSPDELAAVRQAAVAERDKFAPVPNPSKPWLDEWAPKVEGYFSVLFLGEHYPGDFFGVGGQIDPTPDNGT
jgi:hypothetical protein